MGEAEPLWQGILEDASANAGASILQSQTGGINVPLVDYRHEKKSRIPTGSPVVASRGCPNGCEFCSVTRIYGQRVRKIPVSQVLAQVRRPEAIIAFLDDNLTADREYALELRR